MHNNPNKKKDDNTKSIKISDDVDEEAKAKDPISNALGNLLSSDDNTKFSKDSNKSDKR